MKAQEHTSLGEQIAKSISIWILVFMIVITTGIFFVSYFLSKQMFNQQIQIWNSVTPQYALINLIDSDDFSIKREVKVLDATGLFSSFVITDNQKRTIAEFGKKGSQAANLIPIKDEATVIWGYYGYAANFNKYFFPYLIAGGIFSFLVLIIYFIIRSRIKLALEQEFSKFNQFLKELYTTILISIISLVVIQIILLTFNFLLEMKQPDLSMQKI